MKKILFVILAILSLVVFLEVALRLSGRFRTYTEKNFGVYISAYEDVNEVFLHTWEPNDSILSIQTEFQYSYITNEYGLLKNYDYKETNKDSSFVFIGDSFVFGVGADSDSNLCANLSRKLPFNFINAGIPGSDPFFEQVIVDSIFYPLGYKKYLVMVNFSDFYDYIFRGGSERFLLNNKIQYRQAPKLEGYYKKSLLIRGITHLVFKRDFSLQAPYVAKKIKLEAVEEYAKLFTSMSKKIDLVVVLQPYAGQYKTNDKLTIEILNYAYLEALENKLVANNVKTINLDSRLGQLMNKDNYLDYSWAIDGHYNAKGYELLSNIIVEELEHFHPEFLNIK